MKTILKRLKAELKVLAETITITKRQLKDAQRSGTDTYKPRGECGKAQYEFRHKHIVRCLLRGKTIEQIETLPKEGRCPKATCYCCNKPDQKYIDQLMKEYSDEAVRRDQSGPVEVPASSPVVSCSGGVDQGAPAPLVGAERNDGAPQGAEPPRAGGFVNRLAQTFSRLGIL